MFTSCMPVIISYNSYPWIKVALKSFRRFFPYSPILIIDNNFDPNMPGYDPRTEVEREWIKDWGSQDGYHHLCGTDSFYKSHGFALDWAVQWYKSNGIKWMIHFEPDCLIDGAEWANRLLEATKKGIWMAGSDRLIYGPIHLTPSIWNVNQIQSSFEAQLRGSDANHPRFHELVDMKALEPEMTNTWFTHFWNNYWDTAQKPWFDAAIHDKALLVDRSSDFQHFWHGSSHNPDPSKSGDPRVLQYL